MPDLPGFCAPSGVSRSPTVACDRTINLYLEPSSNNKDKLALYSMPGLRPVAELPSAPVRGLYTTTTGRTFAATSSQLFEIFSGWSFLPRGTLPNGTSLVSWTDNGFHMGLTVEGQLLMYALDANTLTTIPPLAAERFGRLAYIDGYMVTHELGTRRFRYSGLYNGLDWPALNFYEAEGRPDPIVSIIADHRELWIPGSQSTEVWYSTGDSNNPFARMQGVFLEQGSESIHSFQSIDNTVMWLGGTPRGEGPVWEARGYQPVRISNHALESAMSDMPTVADAVGFTARHGAHAWYGLDFPSGGETWLYDRETGSWTEVPRLLADGSFWNYPANQHCVAFGVHLWGSSDSGQLYVWDIRYHWYGKDPRYVARVGPWVRDDNDQSLITYASFALRCAAGEGLDGLPAPGTAPLYRLSWTTNGETWSHEHTRSAGRIGEYDLRVTWRQLGQSRGRAFKVASTEPMLHAWHGVSLNGE